MAGSTLGALKRAARQIGLSLEDYQARITNGEKWCTGCKDWHLRAEFTLDNSRRDGLTPTCVTFRKARYWAKRGVTLPLSSSLVAQVRATDPEYREAEVSR